MSDLSLQTLVVISLHLSALMYSPTLLASFVKVDVYCVVFHESSISAMSSAKSKSHNDSSSVHVIPLLVKFLDDFVGSPYC